MNSSMGELPPGYSVNYSAADMSSASIAQGAGQSMPADMSYVSYAQPQRVRSVSPPPVQRPPDLPAEARYVGAVQDPETGNVIDRYVIPRRTTVPVRQTVPELQKITTLKNTTVPEVRTIQVPVERMVPEEYTEMEERIEMVPVKKMVPVTKTRMVPRTFMEEQQITVQKAVQVPQVHMRQVNKVIEGEKIVESEEVFEYERPRVIPGRLRGTNITPSQEVGVQWKRHFYEANGAVQPVADASLRYDTSVAYDNSGYAQGGYAANGVEMPMTAYESADTSAQGAPQQAAQPQSGALYGSFSGQQMGVYSTQEGLPAQPAGQSYGSVPPPAQQGAYAEPEGSNI